MEGYQEKLKQFWTDHSPDMWGIKMGRDTGGNSEVVKATITRKGNVVIEGLSDPIPPKGDVDLEFYSQQAIRRAIDACPSDIDDRITAHAVPVRRTD